MRHEKSFIGPMRQVILRFLTCAILHEGLAGAKCEKCSREYLLVKFYLDFCIS
jgi:hypothetical protein